MTRITRKSRISHKKPNIFLTLIVLLLLARVGIIPSVERVLHLLTRVGITPSEPACGFQTYRSPLHFEGLPQLIEVFATDDSVYFTVLNQGVCEPEWGDGAQMFAPKEKENVRFACEFPHEETTLVVQSDPVPPTDGTLWTEAISVLRCALPSKLQGSVTSSRTVNLRTLRGVGKSIPHGSMAPPRNWVRTRIFLYVLVNGPRTLFPRRGDKSIIKKKRSSRTRVRNACSPW